MPVNWSSSGWGEVLGDAIASPDGGASVGAAGPAPDSVGIVGVPSDAVEVRSGASVLDDEFLVDVAVPPDCCPDWSASDSRSRYFPTPGWFSIFVSIPQYV
jgi:hypothetical protein